MELLDRINRVPKEPETEIEKAAAAVVMAASTQLVPVLISELKLWLADSRAARLAKAGRKDG